MPGPYRTADADDQTFAAAQQLFSSVEQWLRTEALSLTHGELEEQLTVDGREMMGLLFQGHLSLRADDEPRNPRQRARTGWSGRNGHPRGIRRGQSQR